MGVVQNFPPWPHPIGDLAPAAWLTLAQGALTEGSLSITVAPPLRSILSVNFRRWDPSWILGNCQGASLERIIEIYCD
jgi:hypothetical protein